MASLPRPLPPRAGFPEGHQRALGRGTKSAELCDAGVSLRRSRAMRPLPRLSGPAPAARPTAPLRGRCAPGARTSARTPKARVARPSAQPEARPLDVVGVEQGGASSSTLQQRQRGVGNDRLGRTLEPDRAGHQHRPEQRVPGRDGAGEQRRQRPRPMSRGRRARRRARPRRRAARADDRESTAGRAAAGRPAASGRRPARWRAPEGSRAARPRRRTSTPTSAGSPT